MLYRVSPTVFVHITENFRTDNLNSVLDLIYQQTNELRGKNKKSEESFSTFPASVPRAGVEPARVAPLVFETSASTDSAIWAFHLRSPRVSLGLQHKG